MKWHSIEYGFQQNQRVHEYLKHGAAQVQRHIKMNWYKMLTDKQVHVLQRCFWTNIFYVTKYSRLSSSKIETVTFISWKWGKVSFKLLSSVISGEQYFNQRHIDAIC